MAPTIVYPADPAPALVVKTLDGEVFDLKNAASKNKAFTIVVFYRGLHCPLCKNYNKEIKENLANANEQGTDFIVISMDPEERARKTVADVVGPDGTPLRVKMGYGLTEEQARSWGLYMSAGRSGTAEPSLFSEPGLFVIRPDSSVFFAQVQSGPFTRPSVGPLLGGLQYALDNNYPARGDATKQ